MKITFDSFFKRYVVSQCGVIKHLCHTLEDAERLAGMEPEDDRLFENTLSDRIEDDKELSFNELFGD